MTRWQSDIARTDGRHVDGGPTSFTKDLDFTWARVAFWIGAAPVMFVGYVVSWFVPAGSPFAWLAFGGSWQMLVVLAITPIAALLAGGLLALPVAGITLGFGWLRSR